MASSLALYTLATDASFDIDIISPDGVNIPRSERYRQLIQIVESRKDQYKELCQMLNLGMYRIETLTLRRISRLTNRYVPVYKPQEVDDGSIPQRVYLPLPDYHDETPHPVPVYDLEMYAGDYFSISFKFPFDLTTYTPLAQIRLYPQLIANQVGPLLIAKFNYFYSQSVSGGINDTINLTLDGSITAELPQTTYWDLQLTNPSGQTKTYFTGKIYTAPQVSIPNLYNS